MHIPATPPISPYVYGTLLAAGWILIIIGITLSSNKAAFWSLMSIGFAAVLAGVVTWSYGQPARIAIVTQSAKPGPAPSTMMLAEVEMRPPASAPSPAPVQVQEIEKTVVTQHQPIILPIQIVKECEPSEPKPKKKSKKDRKKKKHKKDKERRSKHSEAFQPPMANVFVGEDGMLLPMSTTPYPQYISPEELMIDRQRFQNLPETPDILRRRRQNLLQDAALELRLPTDGSLVPLAALNPTKPCPIPSTYADHLRSRFYV